MSEQPKEALYRRAHGITDACLKAQKTDGGVIVTISIGFNRPAEITVPLADWKVWLANARSMK